MNGPMNFEDSQAIFSVTNRTNSEEPTKVQAKIYAWFIFLVWLVFLVIVWGGIVRLSGSGLSIPEWPLVNGSLLPPLSDKDWRAVYASYNKALANINDFSLPVEVPLSKFKTLFAVEYIHRSLAAFVGIIFLVVTVKSLRKPYIWQHVKWYLVIAAILLLSQAVLGGVVVKKELKAELVAIHLGFAFLFFAVLLWVALKLSRYTTTSELSQTTEKRTGFIRFLAHRKLSVIAWLAMAALLIQVISGGLTAGTKAGLVFNTFPRMGDYLIPPLYILVSSSYGSFLENLRQNQILIHFIHRWWGLVALIFVIALIVTGIKAQLPRRARLALRMVGTATVFQVLWGIMNLLLKVPLWVSVVHLGTALLIWGLLILIAYESSHNYEVEIT